MSAPNLITDLAIRQLPSSPLFSGLLGLNAIAIDPNFGTQIMRLTDGSSGNGANFDSMQTDDDPSGYAMWNTDDTMILSRSTGGSAFIFQFNPTTMQGTQLGGVNPSFPYKLSGANTPSHVNNGIVYNCPANGTVVNALTYLMVDGVWTYQSTEEVCDFANILPGGSGFHVTWQSELEVSSGDSVFTLAFSDTGGQNTGIYCCIYKPGSGYRMINTQTLAITGQWGAIGTAVLENTPATNFYLHGVNQPPNPVYTCLGPKTLDDTFIWANETLTITSTGLGGHHGIGFVDLYTGNPGGGQYDAVPFSNPSTHSEIIPKQQGPPGLPQYQTPPQVYTGDQHSAMGPLDPNDETILWITNGAPPTFPFTSCWMGEVRGIDVTGAISGQQGTVYRLCQTYNSGQSPQYIVANSLCSPSQTGKFCAFGSDMGGAGTVGPLGSTSGGAVGVIGGNARGDVFIVAVFSRGTVSQPLAVSTSALPGGTIGSPYTATLAATGGNPPYTWAITAGSLPSALSLNAATGVISGTLNASGSFTVTVTDSSTPTPQTASLALSITASAGILPLAITTSGPLASGSVGSPYSATPQATGGVAPYSWALSSGGLPPGTSLNSATGNISGTPILAGNFSFTLTVSDAETPTPQTASSSFSIAITLAIGTTTTNLVSSGTPANQGANVVFTASVVSTGANAPTGIVTFYAAPVQGGGQYSIGAGMVVAGVASLTISTLPLGSLNITASYSGDAYNYPSVSAIFVETIIAAVTQTPTEVSSDPFDLLLNNTASVMTRVASSAGGYGGTSSFSTAATGVACRVSILSVGTDKEFLAKSKEDIAYRKVLLRPWFLDQSPDGSYTPNWTYQGTTYNTEPLTHDHWFQIRGDMYDIFELRNPGQMDHHLEAWCRITLP